MGLLLRKRLSLFILLPIVLLSLRSLCLDKNKEKGTTLPQLAVNEKQKNKPMRIFSLTYDDASTTMFRRNKTDVTVSDDSICTTNHADYAVDASTSLQQHRNDNTHEGYNGQQNNNNVNNKGIIVEKSNCNENVNSEEMVRSHIAGIEPSATEEGIEGTPTSSITKKKKKKKKRIKVWSKPQN